MAFQGDSIYWVEVEKVVPNPFQPRREFDQAKLQELSDSIRMYGVLQPLTVTRKEIQREDGTFYSEYELIAGERRLRASKLAGVAQVPVIIREGEQNEQEKLELAIIENLQREDLNAVDRAIAFKQLADMFGLSHAQVAQKMGRSREYVSNSIRLLGLPEHMLQALKTGEMMEGHARTLLMLTDRPEEQEVVFREILLKKLSVREVERIVRKIATDKVRKKNPGEFDANLIDFEKRFTETLGTRVQIQKTDFGGKLTIDYFSEDDLESILKRIKDEVAEQSGGATAVAALAAATPLEMSARESVVATETPTESAVHQATAEHILSSHIREDSAEKVWQPIMPSPENDSTPLTPVQTQTMSEYKSAEPVLPVEQDQYATTTAHSVVEPPTPLMGADEQTPEPKETSLSDVQHTPEPVADDSDLYSIRNFGV
ncbi:ParB/RepB/Spo0J family partition protein [Candidatus Kaiserbacteria bacterium]|nr:ParB/RepB/Spo0J family partition protein [Candidatus Kaiserbacteria bacterium]